jgi:hypothetical protein
MRASESTKESTLGEKMRGTPGRTAPHYEHNTQRISSVTDRSDSGTTYQYEEDGPWGKNKRGEKRGDGPRGEFLVWAEGVCELGAWVVENLFWVYWRGSRRWDVEVKEVKCRGAVHEGAEEEGNMKRRVTGRRERTRGLGHVLTLLYLREVLRYKLQHKGAHQFKFRLARRRDFYGLDTLLTRCRVEETQESLVRLNAVVGGLFGDLEGELQSISRTQCNRTRAFFEGDSVRIIHFNASG